jgi:hypothetical protein
MEHFMLKIKSSDSVHDYECELGTQKNLWRATLFQGNNVVFVVTMTTYIDCVQELAQHIESCGELVYITETLQGLLIQGYVRVYRTDKILERLK